MTGATCAACGRSMRVGILFFPDTLGSMTATRSLGCPCGQHRVLEETDAQPLDAVSGTRLRCAPPCGQDPT